MLNYEVCRKCYNHHGLDPDSIFPSRNIRVPTTGGNAFRKVNKYKRVKTEYGYKHIRCGYKLVPRNNKSGYTYILKKLTLKQWMKFGKFRCVKSYRQIKTDRNPPERCPYRLEHIVSQDEPESQCMQTVQKKTRKRNTAK